MHAMSASRPAEAGTRSTGHTLLVVDDTPENLVVLGELLQPHYRVRVANSGARALQVAVSEPKPDLILLDVMMPGMDGYEVLERLRANPATRDIPVIFITAMNGTADEERGLSAGAVDYITKPIRPVIVQARVRAQLELKQARDWLKDQNLYLEAEITRRMGENLLIQDVSILALARLAETRDPETGNHLHRTQDYVRTLARHLQDHPRFASFFTDHPVELLAKSAPLHDIGKVGIPDHILLKRGTFEPAELEIMKGHVTSGVAVVEELIRDFDLGGSARVSMLRNIVRSHHEALDGSGYPDGLRAGEIPLEARIVAVADVFDALTSDRRYKVAWSQEEAMGYLAERKGTRFDAACVTAFEGCAAEVASIRQRFEEAAGN